MPSVCRQFRSLSASENPIQAQAESVVLAPSLPGPQSLWCGVASVVQGWPLWCRGGLCGAVRPPWFRGGLHGVGEASGVQGDLRSAGVVSMVQG